MNYRLINKTTQEEILCDKVTIDGFDYYVSDELPKKGDYHLKNDIMLTKSHVIDENCKKIIATNNPNIDIPKVVDFSLLYKIQRNKEEYDTRNTLIDFKAGYNKSQETHPFTKKDMIEFLNWVGKDGYPCIDNTKKGLWVFHPLDPKDYTPEELLQIWKEQRQITLYYESN